MGLYDGEFHGEIAINEIVRNYYSHDLRINGDKIGMALDDHEVSPIENEELWEFEI